MANRKTHTNYFVNKKADTLLYRLYLSFISIIDPRTNEVFANDLGVLTYATPLLRFDEYVHG